MRIAVAWDDGLEVKARALATRLDLPLAGEVQDALLYLSRERLELRQTGKGAPGPIYADFTAGRADYRRKHGGGRGQLLAKAVLAKGVVTVVDATAGMGRDAFVLASLGAEVTLLERSRIVGALLSDALRRAQTSEVADITARMTLYTGDAVTYLQMLQRCPDAVYLDPMYPHTTKSALQKKEMQLFRQLVGPDDDAAELLTVARHIALRRVVVKRPAGAPFLGDARPQGQLESKNTRFDLYLSRRP